MHAMWDHVASSLATILCVPCVKHAMMRIFLFVHVLYIQYSYKCECVYCHWGLWHSAKPTALFMSPRSGQPSGRNLSYLICPEGQYGYTNLYIIDALIMEPLQHDRTDKDMWNTINGPTSGQLQLHGTELMVPIFKSHYCPSWAADSRHVKRNRQS